MSKLKFEHYTFNATSLELHANGELLDLRPKTAELLRELITGRDVVIAKRELIKRIWHTEHVTDQSLFQAMSELRAQLAPLGAIKTFPNRGYQWVVPVAEVSGRRTPVAWAVAATVLVAVAGLVSEPLFSAPSVRQATTYQSRAVTLLPALVAFSEGAFALQRGDTSQALELLELSVVERPDFIEARLLLAEAHLLHGNALQGRTLADNVMTTLDSSVNAYSLIAAMDLLSRADQQLGQMNSALAWATRAADQANSNGFECTAADLHDRVLELVQEHEYSAQQLQASPVFASLFAQRLLNTAMAADSHSLDRGLVQSPVAFPENQVAAGLGELFDDQLKQVRPAHCERLRGGPSGGIFTTPEPQVSAEARSTKRLLPVKPLI